jgi:hypothetical protein
MKYNEPMSLPPTSRSAAGATADELRMSSALAEHGVARLEAP